jgi:uncharacterized membrane protein YidH (DUF202 family)
VEDWEQFFTEKSRRRADVERQEERRRLRQTILGVAAVAALVFAAIALLALAGR